MEKTAEFNKFLIIPKDHPEDVVGFIQVKKGIEILPSDSLLPVIIRDKVEHFLLVKTAEQATTPSPIEPKRFDFMVKLRQAFSRLKQRSVDKGETV